MSTRVDRGFPPGHSMLTGPGHLSDAPLTVEDWRIIYHAYYGFITAVRRVAQDAWKRQAAGADRAADRWPTACSGGPPDRSTRSGARDRIGAILSARGARSRIECIRYRGSARRQRCYLQSRHIASLLLAASTRLLHGLP